MKTLFKDLLAQDRCLACHGLKERQEFLCEECNSKIVYLDGIRKIDGVDCYFSVLYRGSVKKLIYDYKFKGRQKIRDYFASLMAEKIAEKNLTDYSVVIVPSSKKTLKQRGFDHIGEIARALSAKTGMEYIEDCLIKTRETKKQHELSRNERAKNLAGAFGLVKDISGKKILVIDDIVTTGHTLREIGKLIHDQCLDYKFLAVTSSRIDTPI
ncbi:MAG: phosphoribosyltransferase family protein [Finegoldia sp.]|nr:phosphoribosyltransferase family protein [Finegoldia sp.]